VIVERFSRVYWFENCSQYERLFETRRQAFVFMRAQGRVFDGLAGTVQEFVDLIWLPWQSTRLSRRTLKAYRWMLHVHFLRVHGERLLRDLTMLEVEQQLELLSRAGIGVETVRRVTHAVRSICRSAGELGLASIPLLATTRPLAPHERIGRRSSHMTLQAVVLVTWFERCHLRRRRFSSEREAQSFIAENGVSFDFLDGTLAEFCDLIWLPERLPCVAAETLAKYGTLLDGSLLPALGGRKMRELQALDFADYLDAERRRGLSRPSMKLRLAVIRSICRSARHRGVASIPPL
jgi:hypothetical protein